jgi:hypothetical protein
MDAVMVRDRITHFCGLVPGIAQALSGYHAQPPKYPGIAVVLGQATIDYASTEQMWSPLSETGYLMTGLINETQKHVADVDPLITPLVDAFSASTRAAILDTGDGERADNCLIRSIELSQAITYAGHAHYGAVITWEVWFRRFPT